MNKQLLFSFIYLVSIFSTATAQAVEDSIPINQDSLEKELDAFLGFYKNVQSKSYFQVGIGLSNTQFSVSNMALNAQQTQSGMTITPSLQYVHKSGWSLGYNNYLLVSGTTTGLLQHSITPGFVYAKDKSFDVGIYYTHFFTNSQMSEYASPYKNDWYGYAEYNKWQVQPSLAFGYSTGDFMQMSKTDSSITINRPFPRPDTTFKFSIYDTLRARLNDFSVTATLRHQFVFAGKQKANSYTFTPSLLLFFAQNRYDVEYSSASVLQPRTQIYLQNRPQLRDQLISQFRQRFPGLNETRNFLNTTEFSLQSVGLNLDAAAYWGKFFISPQVYFDYYLLSGTDKLNVFYTIQTGFMF